MRKFVAGMRDAARGIVAALGRLLVRLGNKMQGKMPVPRIAMEPGARLDFVDKRDRVLASLTLTQVDIYRTGTSAQFEDLSHTWEVRRG